MDRGFADAKFGSGGADRGPVLYDVKSQAFCPLLHIFFQTPSLPASSWSILCADAGEYDGHKSPGEPLERPAACLGEHWTCFPSNQADRKMAAARVKSGGGKTGL